MKLREGNVFVSVILCTGGYDVTSYLAPCSFQGVWCYFLSGPMFFPVAWYGPGGVWSHRRGTVPGGTVYPHSTDICWWPLKHAVRILQECILVGFESGTRGDPWVVRSQANLSLIFKKNGSWPSPTINAAFAHADLLHENYIPEL